MPSKMPADYVYPYTKLVSFLTDYGFKVSFGEDGEFPRKAISLLLGEREPLQKLTILRNEFPGVIRESRSGLYDVLYHDENRRVIILEMPGNPYEFIEERLQFYGFMQFATLMKRGKTRIAFKTLQPIICICIIKDKIFSNRPWHNHFKLQNRAGQQFGSPIEFHTFELGKFPFLKHQAGRLKTDIQKLLFTMKYAEQLVEEGQAPSFFEETWLAEPLRKLALSSLTAQQLAALNIDYYNNLFRDNREQWAAEREIEEAEQKGELRGIEKGKTEMVLACHDDGFPLETIVKLSRMTVEQVKEILKQQGRIA